MALAVTLYKFSKKVNSTKHPDVATPKMEYTDIELKESTSILTPTIVLNLGVASLPLIPNYAYIPEFERYYFITNITFERGRWFFEMKADPLASFKTEIGAQSLYVIRSASSYDGSIFDTMYETNKNVTISDYPDATISWNTSSYAAGTFVVGVAGQSTTYYLFTKANLDILFDDLFSDDYANQVVDDWANVFPQFKTQLNPLQFITSIMWLPFQVGSPSFQLIRIGYGDVLANTDEIPNSALEQVVGVFNLANHPQVSRGSYLNASPYTRTVLYYPPYGLIDLDSTLLANESAIYTTCDVDLRTGLSTLKIKTVLGDIISTVNGQVGINYQVSQVINSGYGIGDFLESYYKGVGSAIGGGIGGIASGAGSVVSGVKSAVGSKIPSAKTMGGTGSINSLKGTPTLYREFIEIIDEDLTSRGRPLCEKRTINTLTGYILVSDADIEITATEAEQKEVRSYMEGGFFYE